MTDDDDVPLINRGEPWQWPELTWRPIVERVRAGRSLKPRSWPYGARCAVAISFDADHETVPLREGDEGAGRLSQGQFGARQGVPRIRDLLARESIPATFFYPAVAAILHPDEVRSLAQEGHEIGVHSWISEVNSRLPFEAERDLAFRALEMLDQIAGRPPVGIRTAAYDYSQGSMQIIREMRMLYDSSLMADDDPYEIVQDGDETGVVELPVEWIRDDATYFDMLRFGGLRPHASPPMVADIFKAEFDGAWEEGGLFQLTLHPHIIGHRSRMPVLRDLIAHIKARGSVWFATHQQVAQYVKDAAGLVVPVY